MDFRRPGHGDVWISAKMSDALVFGVAKLAGVEAGKNYSALGAAIICAHNHPSGEPTPSPEDIFLTRQVVDAGKLLDIDVLDHLVIGQGKFVSMRERGLGFSNL